ncbi:MAG: amidophosphoribosyltransferase [Gammaproteobacteria bacterium]|nr:amidophosphoribosyltransferase [Gammaproteobacteria bacterium]
MGVVGRSGVNQMLYDALTVIQHRGQDAAGIMTYSDGRFNQRKGNGLARDVFRQHHMDRLAGNIGVAHCRYPTAGSSSAALAQPFYVNSPYGIALAHNGNLVNAEALKEDVFREDLRHVNTDSDSEVILNVFAHELQKLGKLKPAAEDIFHAVKAVHRRCSGGYAVVAMIANYGIVAFRDPRGIRPLVYGRREHADGPEYMVASESVALSAQGFDCVADVAPGQAVFIEADGQLHLEQCSAPAPHTPCIFEYVYFARPDSIIDDISVYKARLRMGEKLSEKIQRLCPQHDIDVVIPIPDTSRVSAQVIAYNLGVKFREGLIKNRYIGRTFIMPGQSARKRSVRQKLNAIELEFRDKNVLLVDDSIVRGTTCNEIIQMAREAGARKVYFASAAPPVRYPNVYGIDMPSAEELIAHDKSVDEICALIGADQLIYQDLEDLVDCAKEGNPGIENFDCAVFDGVYVTGDVDQSYLAQLHSARNDAAKNASAKGGANTDAAAGDDSALVDLYNDVS